MLIIYAISDPHLPPQEQVKRYNVPPNYFQHLMEFLTQKKTDILLIAGDLIWGYEYSSVQEELKSIQNLPGKYKIFIEGNHDLWIDNIGSSIEESRNKMYDLFSTDDFYFISGRAKIITIKDRRIGICGTRGFAYDIKKATTEEDIHRREYELNQLDQSLKHLKELVTKTPTDLNICLIHYPPTTFVFEQPRSDDNAFFEMIKDSKLINKIIYGHVHVENDLKLYVKCEGIELYCASIDRNEYQAVNIANME